MSIFTPVDVRGPDARRKQLMQKMLGQAQSAHGASAATPMPANMGSVLAGAGRTFRNATDFRGLPKINVTQGANIIPSILSRLGAVGTSHASEHSPGPGRSIGAPVAPAPVGLPGQVAAPVPPGVADPAPPVGGGTPVTAPGGRPIFGDNFGGTPTPFTPPAAGSPGGDAFTPPADNRIPLGGDLYYDPMLDTVLRGTRVVGRSI